MEPGPQGLKFRFPQTCRLTGRCRIRSRQSRSSSPDPTPLHTLCRRGRSSVRNPWGHKMRSSRLRHIATASPPHRSKRPRWESAAPPMDGSPASSYQPWNASLMPSAFASPGRSSPPYRHLRNASWLLLGSSRTLPETGASSFRYPPGRRAPCGTSAQSRPQAFRSKKRPGRYTSRSPGQTAAHRCRNTSSGPGRGSTGARPSFPDRQSPCR